MIPKKDMVPGGDYKGICRNAHVAHWDEKKQEFVYIRYKFGYMMDTIAHFEDVADTRQDGFIPLELIPRTDPVVVRQVKEELGY